MVKPSPTVGEYEQNGPMNATYPGLLSVGTQACETPDAPRSEAIDF